jgi:putative ATPase
MNGKDKPPKDLFDQQAEKLQETEAPLAARMRPRTLDDFVGQSHLVGEGHVLRKTLASGKLPSMIFWGPAGCGKTTLAYIIANQMSSHFSPISAVSASVADLRQVFSEAKERRKLYQQSTILFIDEIHRFNKAQQDSILPYVEDGTVTLIGATTENPSFEVITPLLSRSRVYKMNPLEPDEMHIILSRALHDRLLGLGKWNVSIENDALERIIAISNNDARSSLNTLEVAALTTPPNAEGKRIITLAVVDDTVQHRYSSHDKTGEMHFDLISVLHKSLRGSDPNAAVYWLTRMLEGGEDPMYIIRRMVRFASEDIGMADPQAIVVAMACQQAVHFIGLPEASLALVEAAVYLATAPKSNSLYTAHKSAQKELQNGAEQQVPLHLRNAPTKLMKDEGYGAGYKYAHDYADAFVPQQYLPDAIKDVKFYRPGNQGYEKEVADRLKAWWGEPETPPPDEPKISDDSGEKTEAVED